MLAIQQRRLLQTIRAIASSLYNCEHVGHLTTPAPTDRIEHSPVCLAGNPAHFSHLFFPHILHLFFRFTPFLHQRLFWLSKFSSVSPFLENSAQPTPLYQDSGQTWRYELLFCFVPCFVENLFTLYFASSILHCESCGVQIERPQVDLAKIIGGNSANLANQRSQNLLRTAKL
jgi:hypothetical protein